MAQSSRLDLLKRKNAGQRLLPGLRQKLALALAVSPTRVNFLPLEESDAVRDRASHAFPPRYEIEGRSGNYPFFSRRIGKAEASKPLLPDAEADILVILPESDTVGVLRVPLAAFNVKWGKLLDTTLDGLVLVDSAFSNKAVVQTDKDETSGDVRLDLAAWGEAWSKAVRDFLG